MYEINTNSDHELLSIDISFNSLKNQFFNTNNNFIDSINNFFTELTILKNNYIEKNLEVDKILYEINKEKQELIKKNNELEEFKKVSFISSMHKRLEEKEQELSSLQQKYNILGKRHNNLIISSKNNQESDTLKINQSKLSKKSDSDIISETELQLSNKHNSNKISETELQSSNKSDSDKISETELLLSNKSDSDKISETELLLSNKSDSDKISETELQISNKSDSDKPYSNKISKTELQISNKSNSDKPYSNKISETELQISNKSDSDKIIDSESSNLQKSSSHYNLNNEEQSSDFEAEIDGKIYLFSKDDNGNGVYFKKLKNGTISKKISGNWKEDSDGELIID